MRGCARTVTAAALVIGTLAALHAASAAAATQFTRCRSEPPEFGCTRFAVPLDHSGQTPGTITLALRRQLSPNGVTANAIVALAGGPGQAAVPLAPDFAQAIAPALQTHDLIVFDQRGTGRSEPLRCPRLTVAAVNKPVDAAITACANHLGPARAHYQSIDSADDIESIRQALGYEKLVLYGTSYGTKVALQYAQRYPDHVEGLLLDSTVGLDGPDVFSRSTLAASMRVLHQLCAARACAKIAREPVGDVEALVPRMREHPLRGVVFDGRGRRHKQRVTATDLLSMMVGGDLDPLLRVGFPAAVHSALHGDPAALARMDAQALRGSDAKSQAEGLPLDLSTTCEELAFPWDRASGTATRLRQAGAAFAALPPRALEPFGAAAALQAGPVPQCAAWPNAAPAPLAGQGPLPAVPTLLLSGAVDVRTPTEDARAVAAQIPGAQLLVVPNVGHSVVGADPSSCAANAVKAFFAGTPVAACRRSSRHMALFAVAPTQLKRVARTPGVPGPAGRTLTAVALTLVDAERQLGSLDFTSVLRALFSSHAVGIGGLRGGYATVSRRGLRFRMVSYVPGVTVTGLLPLIGHKPSLLRVGGRAAARGVLRLGPGSKIRGVLGGHVVQVDAKAVPVTASAASAPPARLARLARVG